MRIPKLDKNFQPFIRTLEEYERDVAAAEHTAEAAIAVKRNGGCYYVYRFRAFSDGAGQDMRNCLIAERIAKTILWTAGEIGRAHV